MGFIPFRNSRCVFARKHTILVATAALFSSSSTNTLARAFSTMPSSITTSNIDKLALVLVRDRKQLVARSKGKTAFFTPGGKREGTETDEEALCRECKEELTVDLIQSTIRPYGVFSAQAFGKPEGTMVRLTCYSADYQGTLCPNEEIEELRWITSDCPASDLTVTGIMLLEDLKSKDMID
mmetsp:Transcript_6893/g.9005  ORF Transcript_6893/g.9005 Transcript_6893/m.9005 type:complete len:181 (-) Transcript_6893:282-824(-)